MMWLRGLLVTGLAVALGACATQQSTVKQDSAHLAAVQAAAGEQVGSFPFPTAGLYSWQVLSERDVLVYTRPNRAWLVDVGPCPQLSWAPFIYISTHMGQVNTLSDSVRGGRSPIPCMIRKVRPVDVKKLNHQPPPRGRVEHWPATATSA